MLHCSYSLRSSPQDAAYSCSEASRHIAGFTIRYRADAQKGITMKKEKASNYPASFYDATGPISVTLRNDMMFHRAMHSSKKALKGLVCALKGLDPDTVKDVELTNPIDYSAFANKEIILDVKVILNSSEILDIELQLYHSNVWERRSLLYLCRSFDSIGVGEKYSELKPTTLIAIMDNPMFPDYPEFYSHYMFLNTKNHQPYSTLLSLNVLYLNRTDLATEEDIKHDLVYWAKLFQTTTWEDLKALCTAHPDFEEVAKAMYKSNIQSQEKTLFEAHQKFLMDKAAADEEAAENERQMAELKEQMAKLKEEAIELKEQAAGYKAQTIEYKEQIISVSTENARLRKMLADAGIAAD